MGGLFMTGLILILIMIKSSWPPEIEEQPEFFHFALASTQTVLSAPDLTEVFRERHE